MPTVTSADSGHAAESGTPWIAGSFVISAGGTYTAAQIGSHRTNDSAAASGTGVVSTGAPVYVNTTAAVTIDGVSLWSTHGGLPCIYAIPGASITVTNCSLYSWQRYGYCAWFEAGSSPLLNLTFQHNFCYGGTVKVGSGSQGQLSACSIKYNQFQDIYGSLTSLADRFLQAVQFTDVYGPNIEVAWNYFLNHLNQSGVADIITFFADSGTRCGGTLSSRASWHDNMFDGGWTSPAETDTSYSGSGGITDLYGNPELGGFLDIHDNQYVAMCNSGPAPSSGHSIACYSNRVISSGLVPDGSAHANVSVNGNGIEFFIDNGNGSAEAVWDGTDAGGGWGGNSCTNNVSGFMRPSSGVLVRADYFIENASYDPVTTSGNLHVAAAVLATDPWLTGSSSSSSYVVTNADQDAERARWQNKLTAAGVTIGPLSSNAAISSADTPHGAEAVVLRPQGGARRHRTS